ncbi:MAG: branched-chain amino acid ABC transporter permease [Bacillota bacterium]
MDAIAQVVLAGLIMGGVYALIALGLNLIYGTMRLLNVAHGELIMFGAFAAYWMYTINQLSPLFSLLLVAVGSALFGIFIFFCLFNPLLKRSQSQDMMAANSLLIFFALSIIMQNIAVFFWGANLRSYTYMSKVIHLAGVPVTANRLLSFAIGVVLCLGCYLLIQKTLVGKAIRAVIQDRECCKLMGINVNKIYIISFAISFAMAGVAGVLLSMYYVFSPFMGLPYTVIAFIVVILGGMGNVGGSLLAGFILGLVSSVGTALTSPGLESVISYLIFILVVLFKPKGIFGKGF